jgi:hypothetical protein
MEIKDYCTNVTAELSGWKAKVDGVVRKLDHISTGDKERVVPEVNELHMLSDELYDRIEVLTRTCMTSWQPQPEFGHDVIWPEQSARMWETVSQSDFGG